MKTRPFIFAITALVFLFLIVLSLGSALSDSCPNLREATLEVDQVSWSVGVATTSAEKALGLGGCRKLPDHTGLIFPFNPPVTPSFWMKGMIMPIDIIWIYNGEVTGIEANIKPPTPGTSTADITQYTAPGLTDTVLEIGAGEAEKNGIRIGSKVLLRP